MTFKMTEKTDCHMQMYGQVQRDLERKAMLEYGRGPRVPELKRIK